MENQNYNLAFLPLFETDLANAVDYITDVLHSPLAAQRLVDQVEKAIFERLNNPPGYAPYRSLTKRPNDYYTITVKNCTIFYVLIGNTMEVRRFLYNKRDVDKLL